MAILSNINDKFAVDSTGAIQFNGQAGTSGYILKSNGNTAPTWVDPDDVIGGPYLPLTGGTLTGNLAISGSNSLSVGGALTVGGVTALNASTTIIRDSSGYALRLDSANATTDNDLRFAKGGTDYAAIQVTGSTASDFQFYVNDGTNWINTLTFARADGQAVFTKLVSGIAPTADLNFATKKYVDDGRPDPGVTQITAGTNVTITPVGGTGNVTINANTQGDITALTLGNGLTGTSLTGPIPNVLMSGSYTGKFTIDSTGDFEYLVLNTTATTNKRVRLQFTQNDNAGMEIGTDYSVDDSSNIYFYDRVAGSAMFFTSVASSYFPGSLRIGMTAASSQKLHVQGSNHFVTFENTSTTANHYSQMLLKAGTALGYIWTANQNSTLWGGPNSLNIYTGAAGAIAFFTTGIKRMSIQAAGNVYIETKLGIANSNPPAKLTVGPTISSGATGISINVGAGEGNLIGIGNNNHNWFPFTNGQNYYSSDVHNFRNAAHSTTYMTLDSVGLGIVNALTVGTTINAGGDIKTTGAAIGTTQADGDYLAKLYTASADGFLSLYTGQATPIEQVRISSYGPSYIVTGTLGGFGLGSSVTTGGFNVNWTFAGSYYNMSNTDSGNFKYTNPNGRLLTSNGTGWVADGRDPILTLSSAGNGGATTVGYSVGLNLYSNTSTDNTYSPLICFSNLSNSGSYATTYAAIGGKKTGQGVDANWSTGELHFWTAGPAGAGSAAYMQQASAMMIDDAGAVGIATNTPRTKLEVAGETLFNSLSFKANRINSGYETAANDADIWINYEGYLNGNSYNRDFRVGNGRNGQIMMCDGGTNRVFIGTGSTPSYPLDVTGTIRATGDVIAYSDARVKDNVKTIDYALEKTTKLRGVSYTRNDIEDKSTKIGVIAQEVLEVLPEVVSKDDEGKYSVSYGNIVGVLIEAIKELEARVKELENK